MRALREKGIQAIDFGIGDPSSPTPDLIREKAQEAIETHRRAGYPGFIGSMDFREAVARWIDNRFGVTVDPETEVTSSIGSKEMVFNAHFGFVNPGDVVVFPTPGYPPYDRGTAFSGAEAFRYPVLRGGPCVPDLAAIPEDVLSRTKMLWVTSPHSPTGITATLPQLQELADGCRERGILLLCDEAYSEIYFDARPPSALQTGKSGVLSVFSLSKRSAMTGYRVGYAVGDPEAIRILRLVKMSIDSGTPLFIQEAAIAALSDEEHVRGFREEYREKRDILADAFVSIGLPDCRPEAALYLWQQAPPGCSGIDFARSLLHEDIAVVATPGEWLSQPTSTGENPGSGHVRMAFVPTLWDTKKAAERIKTHRELILRA